MNPIAVLHIPHSSILIPEEERNSILLSDNDLADEIIKMTDKYTDELFKLDGEESKTVLFPVSRIVLDPERFEDDSLEVMSSLGMGVIYTKAAGGQILRNKPTPEVRKRMLEKYWSVPIELTRMSFTSCLHMLMMLICRRS